MKFTPILKHIKLNYDEHFVRVFKTDPNKSFINVYSIHYLERRQVEDFPNLFLMSFVK